VVVGSIIPYREGESNSRDFANCTGVKGKWFMFTDLLIVLWGHEIYEHYHATMSQGWYVRRTGQDVHLY